MGFISVITIGEGAVAKVRKSHTKGKGNKRAGITVALVGVDIQPYTPVKLPSSKEAYIKAMAASLGATNAILPSPLCANPMLPLVVTLVVFKATLDS